MKEKAPLNGGQSAIAGEQYHQRVNTNPPSHTITVQALKTPETALTVTYKKKLGYG